MCVSQEKEGGFMRYKTSKYIVAKALLEGFYEVNETPRNVTLPLTDGLDCACQPLPGVIISRYSIADSEVGFTKLLFRVITMAGTSSSDLMDYIRKKNNSVTQERTWLTLAPIPVTIFFGLIIFIMVVVADGSEKKFNLISDVLNRNNYNK
jgi:hypothetical protein